MYRSSEKVGFSMAGETNKQDGERSEVKGLSWIARMSRQNDLRLVEINRIVRAIDAFTEEKLNAKADIEVELQLVGAFQMALLEKRNLKKRGM